jgi:predicted HTH transcriptional regulator
MKEKIVKVYKFEELSEAAKKKAIEELNDINLDYEWWLGIYDDAENIGLEITEFDILCGKTIKGTFFNDAIITAQLIIANHGEICETYQDAQNYIKEYKESIEKQREEWRAMEDVDVEGDFDEDEADTEDIDDEFLKTLLEDYLVILSKEYDYLTSEEAIIETIEANDYDFLANGQLSQF